ncbi:hypothetical protein PRIPAC_76028 [Pristionchus pacificus]|uniref:DUF7622 domain-containing protein n=1 Tax=Pristionchus pacificus TaxID=54126 RepID=A0A2A6CSH9_PRIPA|nr:hypothetical protein PRIPAC_76028 [Pristionchus pacificus]|eukprot:PDM81001.1 hypothetical protein PRIPAC_36004 [Pristionchus pacificus]
MMYLLILFILPLSVAIRCIDCTYNGTSKHCNAGCKGDMCGVWKWNDRGKEFIRQGCISGIPSARIGCRTNQVGASLCLCNDFDLCNTQHRSVSTVPTLPIVRLPSVDCISILHFHPIHKEADDFPLQIESSHARCHSDYCHFTRTESSLQSTMGNLSISLCSPHPEFEFDLQIHAHPLRALHSNFCYSIKTTKETKEIQCICSSKMCNRNLVNAMEEGPIQCYTVDGTEDSAKVDKSSLCYGDFCFIRQSEEGRFTKGCLSIRQMGNEHHPYIPGNRSIFGEIQWLCTDQLCNHDMNRLDRSINKKVFTPIHLPINGVGHTSFVVSISFLIFF